MVLGITMAAFMLASVMVAMVPIGGAECRDDNFNHSVKDRVNIFAVGPKGSAGRAIDSGKISTNYAKNIFGKTVPVSTLDRTFEKKIDVDENADTGS